MPTHRHLPEPTTRCGVFPNRQPQRADSWRAEPAAWCSAHGSLTEPTARCWTTRALPSLRVDPDPQISPTDSAVAGLQFPARLQPSRRTQVWVLDHICFTESPCYA